ncbi:MAG: RagB/SusD family nutrient uptake outer membrane protein [Rikenellaceae bacterium]|nr:RagB/SusD family nutrient uptake outer membrane protein [Rikenellaceae bacterium]
MKKILFALIACAGLAFTSCELDEYNPKEITGDEILATYDGYYGMQAQCYAPIYGQLYTVTDFIAMAEGGTDLWVTANNKTHTKEMFYYESLVPSAGKGWDKAFTQMYSALGLCNAIINRADAVAENPEYVKVLKAEAHFLRAYYHLLLTTYYGPITLVTSEPSESPILAPKRNSLSEIYSLIISDLNEAINVLGETPFENNRQRPSKAAARGMLARAYIQGAGQGLTENGKSYYERAKEVAEAMIADYGTSKMYNDIDDMWADANNRNNKEMLFVAGGVIDNGDSNFYWYAQPGNNKIFGFTYPGLNNINDLSGIKDNKNGTAGSHAYGRLNSGIMVPTKYLIDAFDMSWDKRWENSFQTAFGRGSFLGWSHPTYEGATFELTAELCAKYDVDPQHVGKKIYPLYNAGDNPVKAYPNAGNQYTVRVWPFGNTNGLYEDLVEVKKPYVIDPTTITPTENRLFLYLSKKKMSDSEKAQYQFPIVNIDDMITSDGSWVENADAMTALKDKTSNIWQMHPAMNKYQWGYDGVFYGSNLQVKNGDIIIQRMAEIYLIAAEANVALGDGATAAQYLNVLRKRAARAGVSESTWKLTTADKEVVLDEYARELCGEFQRWAVLQRNGALKDRLSKYNKRAAAAFQDYCVWRPMSQTFLQQIDNAEEYGDNGYGTTAKSGLDGFLQ